MRGKRVTGTAMLGLVLVAAWPAGPGPLRAQEAAADTSAVVDAARTLVEGITTGDTMLLRSVTPADLRLEGTATRGSLPSTAAGQTRGELLAMVSGTGVRLVERIWSPTVRIRGRIADVRAPYDVYQDGEFSHCGVDLFQLVQTARGWQVVSVLWTLEQPPACRRHPDGPPLARIGGDGGDDGGG